MRRSRVRHGHCSGQNTDFLDLSRHSRLSLRNEMDSGLPIVRKAMRIDTLVRPFQEPISLGVQLLPAEATDPSCDYVRHHTQPIQAYG